MSLPTLDATEQRVIGSLLEKQVTVPASYPLTLNALRTACNQSTSRDPVVDYDAQLVETTARALKGRGLLRIIWDGRGQRTQKFHQLLDEVLGLGPDERAVLTVLLLRGAQSAGEVRTRTERMHGFTDRAAVEATLARLAARDEPLVQELARRPGWQDPRWIHLLGPVDIPGGPVEPAAATALDLDSVIGDGVEARDARVSTAYTSLAGEYATQKEADLADLPFERWLLDRVADLAQGRPVADAGCGPGHISRYLADRGVHVVGSDRCEAMVEEARSRYPDLRFEVGDLRRLMRPTDADGWGAVLGWYSLVHFADSELADVVAALARPLRAGGWLLLGMHAGPGVRHVDERWGIPVDLDYVAHDPARVIAAAEAAGLNAIEWYRRGSVRRDGPEEGERFYLLGRAG